MCFIALPCLRRLLSLVAAFSWVARSVRPWATMYGAGNKGSRRDTEKTARTHTHDLMETVNAENLVLLNEPQLFVVFFSFYLTNMQSSGVARTTRARRVHPHVRGVRAPLGAQVVRKLISLSTTSYLRGHHNSALAHATEKNVQCNAYLQYAATWLMYANTLSAPGQGRWKQDLNEGTGCREKNDQPTTLSEEKGIDQGGLPG